MKFFLFPAFLIGKIPLWVPVAFLIGGKLDLLSAACAIVSILMADGYLNSIVDKRSTAGSTFLALYKRLIKPLLLTVFSIVCYYDLYYVVFFGNQTDCVLAMSAVLAATGMFLAKSLVKSKDSRSRLLDRNMASRITLFLLWAYLLLGADDRLVLKILTIIAIYTLEFASIYKLQYPLKMKKRMI
jgi:hypothetical protein